MAERMPPNTPSTDTDTQAVARHRLAPLGMDTPHIEHDFDHYYHRFLGRNGQQHCDHYTYEALALTLRDRLMERWKQTTKAYQESGCKRAYYLSLEFLMGRALGNAMLNLGISNEVEQGLYDLGLLLEELSISQSGSPGIVSATLRVASPL